MSKEEFKYEPHNFKKPRSMPWSVCVSCGLVSLNNRFTEWSVDKGCNSRYHPSYALVKNKHTKLFD